MIARGHRQTILGTGTRLTSPARVERRSVVGQAPVVVHRCPPTPQPRYEPPPQWRAGPGDPNIKRKWLMHIEDERAGDWKL